MIGRHRIIAIVAVDERWAIGKHKQLLYHIPTDLKFFKEATQENIIVYGANTLLSFPNGQPLKNRINILLSRKEHARVAMKEDCYVAHDIDQMVKIIEGIDNDKDVFICGGESVYRQLLDMCDGVYLTKIHARTNGADAHFPNIDRCQNWEIADDCILRTIDETSGLTIEFIEYKRKATL